MYLNLRTTLGILILAAAAFGSWWLAQTPRDPQSLPLGRGVPPPGYYLREAKVSHSGADGKLLLQINAQSAQENAATQSMQLDGVRIDYLPSLDIPWALESDYGIAPLDQSYIELSGAVTITALGGSPAETLVIRTAKLTLEPANQIATTDSRVQIEIGQQQLNATGMVAHLGDERLEFTSNVNGKFNP